MSLFGTPPAVEGPEVGPPSCIAGNDLTIQHRIPGRQVDQHDGDGLEAGCEVVAVAAEDHDVLGELVRLDAVAVELHLMQPVVADGDALGRDRPAGLDEAGHAGHV
jgi:hypothetical protein